MDTGDIEYRRIPPAPSSRHHSHDRRLGHKFSGRRARAPLAGRICRTAPMDRAHIHVHPLRAVPHPFQHAHALLVRQTNAVAMLAAPACMALYLRRHSRRIVLPHRRAALRKRRRMAPRSVSLRNSHSDCHRHDDARFPHLVPLYRKRETQMGGHNGRTAFRARTRGRQRRRAYSTLRRHSHGMRFRFSPQQRHRHHASSEPSL